MSKPTGKEYKINTLKDIYEVVNKDNNEPFFNINMDLQKLVDTMNETSAKQRSSYHLTYGQLIKALKSAPNDAVFDKRVKGIGSWRGSYIEIALFTDSEGYSAEREEFNDYGSDNYAEKYKAWEEKNRVSGKLPTNANELGKLLESLLGLQFVGYKGGNFTIEEYKPLWLETDDSTYDEVAIIGIDKDLNLITKNIE